MLKSSQARSQEAIAYRKWYNTAEWRERRERQLADHPFCVMCEEEGRQRLATVADHDTPHRGDWEIFIKGKLNSLCSHHHNSVKQSKEHTGIRKGFDADGNPLDKSHPWFASERGHG
jgi:hypothetical protein